MYSVMNCETISPPTTTNPNRLVEVAQNQGRAAYLIQDAGDIDPTWLGAAFGSSSKTIAPFDVSTTACFPVISAIEYGVVNDAGLGGA